MRLRQPRGYIDPGGFDYEGWLSQHDVGATGYALKQAQPLSGAPRYPLLRLRAALLSRTQQALGGDEFAGMAAAVEGAAPVWLWPAEDVLLLKASTVLKALSWPLMKRLTGLPGGMLPAPAPGVVATAIALMEALWLLMPRGSPTRALGALLMLPLFVTPPSGIRAGDFSLTLLDVGQGLSAVVSTAGHTLVFDTGTGFQSGNDTGEEVVIPYLRSQDVAAPDLAVVSHSDLDHSGGFATLREAWPAMPVLSGAEGRFRDVRICLRGQCWDWDGVRFQVLYPDADAPASGNDASCVLKMNGPGGSLLLTGDIMNKGEKRLLALDTTAVAS